MRHHAFVVFPMALAFLAHLPLGGGEKKPQGAKADAIKQDLKRLAGTWELAHWGMNGRLVDRSQWERALGAKTHRITILEGGSVDAKDNNGRGPKFVLDPTVRPKTLDYFTTSATGVDLLASVGIYELNEDEWIMCYVSYIDPRPTAFTFDRGSRNNYKIYRRVKDKK
jgi:uncharacterized protein (TIGR03067 family)